MYLGNFFLFYEYEIELKLLLLGRNLCNFYEYFLYKTVLVALKAIFF